MPLGYVLNQLGNKLGLDPGTDQQPGEDRPILLRIANEAARELYPQADFPGSLMEQVFKINGDQTISMPSYVGPLRGMREYASMQTWHINQMRPRYNQFNWTDMWRNYRLKNKQALQNSVVNQSFGIITVKSVEDPPIVVTVSGPTDQATLINESVTMDSVSKSTVNVFLDYSAVKKDRVNTVDVTLSDVDGRVLTVIPNYDKQAMYQIVDVSACPWLPMNTSPLDNYIEVLYKQKLKYLFYDADEFPAFDLDDALVNKGIQLTKEEQDKIEVAQAYDTKATRTAARVVEDQNRATEDCVALVANFHDTVLKRIGTGLRRRYSLYAGRKY